MYKAVKVLLLALAALTGLASTAPAFASTAGHEATVSDCCPPALPCDGPAAICFEQQVCQPPSQAVAEKGQAPLFALFLEARPDDAVVPSIESAAALPPPAAHGPPPYLLFHRFLL